jgi:RHS repeat-associated protein
LVRWALADQLGSVRDVVDGNGVVVNHLVYDSFGNIESESNGAVDFRFGYTGREFDSESGQYYYRARYYDAGVGRFLGEDPISFVGGDANLYRYVGNNSITYTDPTGLWLDGADSDFDFWGLVGAGIGGLIWLGQQAINPSPYRGNREPAAEPTPVPPIQRPKSPPAPATPATQPTKPPKPRVQPKVKGPDCETCATKYGNKYLTEAELAAMDLHFGGFKYKKGDRNRKGEFDSPLPNVLPNVVPEAMQDIKRGHLDIRSGAKLVAEEGETMLPSLDPPYDFLSRVPIQDKFHFNVVLDGTTGLKKPKSGGSAIGLRICVEGKPPTLQWRYNIHNVKSKDDIKHTSKQR